MELDWLVPPVYEWIKAGHVITVIFWMAGMFMLPRYFAYHCETAVGSPESEAWKLRERRLLRIIVNPSMALAWVFGLLLSFSPVTAAWSQGWFHAKFALVFLVLSGFHGFLAGQVRHFERDQGIRNGRTWRVLNEIPGVVIILVVILVIVKPF